MGSVADRRADDDRIIKVERELGAQSATLNTITAELADMRDLLRQFTNRPTNIVGWASVVLTIVIIQGGILSFIMTLNGQANARLSDDIERVEEDVAERLALKVQLLGEMGELRKGMLFLEQVDAASIEDRERLNAEIKEHHGRIVGLEQSAKYLSERIEDVDAHGSRRWIPKDEH